MSYIKIKKLWFKKFSNEEIEEIFQFFKENSPVPNKEWSDIDFVGAVAKYGQFFHPETDKYDDSEGLQPKEMKFLKTTLKDEFFYFLEKITPSLNHAASMNYFSGYVSEGFISWSLVYQNHILRFLNEDYKNVSLDAKIGLMMASYSPIFQQFSKIDNAVLEKLGQGVYNERTILDARESGLLANNIRVLRLEHINLDGFFEERRAMWFSTHKIKPKSEQMLRVNPINFNKKVLDVVNETFGTRQIGSLKEQEQQWVALLIDNFSINMMVFPKEIISKVSSVNQLSFDNQVCKDFTQTMAKLIKTEKDINIGNLKLVLNALHNYEALEDFILNKDKLLEMDIDVIYFIANMINQLSGNSRFLNSVQKIDPRHFKVFYRYRVQDYGHIIKLVDLYERSQKVNLTIPIVSGTVGKYTYEIIEKDNPIGLILGYATDCCQVIGGQGVECLEHGYTKTNSSFFVVRKGHTVYAQSWIWSRKTKEGEGLCFDSIEVLGKDLTKSQDILKCYKEASEKLVEAKYDIVYAGADGNTMPKGLRDVGKFLDIPALRAKNMESPFDIYSDVDGDSDLGGIVILNKKNDNKKD